MKKQLTIFLIIVLFTSTNYSQKVGEVFTPKSSSALISITYIKDIDARAAVPSENLKNLAYGVRYEVTKVDATDVYFVAKTLVPSARSAKGVNYKEYKMLKSDYTRVKGAKGKERLSYGIITLPLKLRSSEGEINFETEFNANFALSVKLGQSFINDWDLTWQVGFGFGSTDLTSANSSIAEGLDQSVQVLTALTGLMYSYKGIQIGVYWGVDHINNQSQYNWDYHGNGFVSAGIGFNLFGGKPKDEVKE